MWSVKVTNGVRALGLEVVTESPDVAIVNLGESDIEGKVAALKAQGVKIIAHAGHKETELLDLGRDLNCDKLVTNSELTNKLGAILESLRPVAA